MGKPVNYSHITPQMIADGFKYHVTLNQRNIIDNVGNITSVVEAGSGNWNSTYSTVLANSASWNTDISGLSPTEFKAYSGQIESDQHLQNLAITGKLETSIFKQYSGNIDGDIIDIDYVPTHYTATTTTISGNLDGINTRLTTILSNTQTDSYQLQLSDAGKEVRMNKGSANNLTVPASGTVNFPIGTMIAVVQVGSGTTSVVGANGVTMNGVTSGGSAKGDITGQYKGVMLIKIASDTWDILGAIGTIA